MTPQQLRLAHLSRMPSVAVRVLRVLWAVVVVVAMGEGDKVPNDSSRPGTPMGDSSSSAL